MKAKMKWIMTSVVLCVLLAAVGFNTVNSVRTMRMIRELNTAILESREEEETQEDDVVIGGTYRIESTVHISDAYKSGDTSGLTDREKETLDMASDVLHEIIKDGMTPYEKERAVYEWMTKELQFDQGALVVIPTSSEDCDNPYGTLKYHNAVCVGYATTFRLFMQMMDIDCMVVHDNGRFHSWNLVKLDDEWYHTDIYFDAGSSNYVNFNMNDTMAFQGHDWDTFFFPAAHGLQYNVGYQNRRELSDIYMLPAFVSEMMEGEENRSCFVGMEGGFEKRQMVLADQMVSMIQERMWSMDLSPDVELAYSWVSAGEDAYYLSLTVTKSNSGGDVEIDPEEYMKMEEAVNEYFSVGDDWNEWEARG